MKTFFKYIFLISVVLFIFSFGSYKLINIYISSYSKVDVISLLQSEEEKTTFFSLEEILRKIK